MNPKTARWQIARGSLIAFTLAGTSMAATVTIDPSTTYQSMDGFGASDNWNGPFTNAQLGTFFNKDTGIGLSILRMGITSSGGNGANGGSWATAKFAAGQGAKLWGAPWSPPGNEKSGGTTTGNTGGYLLPASYDAWASTLATFAAATKTNTGVDLYGISAQNEPDYSSQVTYDGCVYSDAQMAAWCAVLGPKLHSLTPPVKLIAPESFQWGNLNGFVNAIKGNATANSGVDIFATHDYGGSAVAVPNAGRPIWETEVSSFETADLSMTNGLKVAGWIHDALVNGGVSAWHYWWLTAGDNEGLLVGSNPAKRMYIEGNYAKFIRPGFVRISATEKPASGVTLTAFISPTTVSPRQIVVVAINSGSTDNQAFSLTGVSADSAVPWITDANNSLKKQSSVSVTNSAFTYSLGGTSVTTIVVYMKSTSLERQEAGATRVEDVQIARNGPQTVLSIGPAEQPGQVRVLDLSGREIASASILSGRSEVPLPGLRSGMYAVEVTRGDVAVTKSVILP
ncbi:MAG TPA: hypothetical protein VN931_06515 [Fibrobacteria bacterium]|nr:hypothetical protein [Fibrobacteria bacterium]